MAKKCLENWSVRLYNFCWKIPHFSQLMKTGSSIHKYEILCLWYIIILIRKWVLYIHVQRGKKGDSFPKMFPIFFWIRISKSRRLTYSVCIIPYYTQHFVIYFKSFYYKQKIQLLLTHSILSLEKSVTLNNLSYNIRILLYICIRLAIKGSVKVNIQVNDTKWVYKMSIFPWNIKIITHIKTTKIHPINYATIFAIHF